MTLRIRTNLSPSVVGTGGSPATFHRRPIEATNWLAESGRRERAKEAAAKTRPEGGHPMQRAAVLPLAFVLALATGLGSPSLVWGAQAGTPEPEQQVDCSGKAIDKLNGVKFTLLARDVPTRDPAVTSHVLALWSFAFDRGAEIPPRCYPGPIALSIQSGSLDLVVKHQDSPNAKIIVFPSGDKPPFEPKEGQVIPLKGGDSVFQQDATVCYRDTTVEAAPKTCTEGLTLVPDQTGSRAGLSGPEALSVPQIRNLRVRAVYQSSGGASGTGSSSKWPIPLCGDRGC